MLLPVAVRSKTPMISVFLVCFSEGWVYGGEECLLQDIDGAIAPAANCNQPRQFTCKQTPGGKAYTGINLIY